MRPILFIIAVFGVIYLLYVFVTDPTGSEVDFIASIAFAVYSFGLHLDYQSHPWSFQNVYDGTLIFFFFVLAILLVVSVISSRE